MKRILKYVTESGNEPFQDWFLGLDRRAQAKVRAYIDRVALGGSSKNVKPVGEGVHEIKIDFGPGYRIYFGLQGTKAILLLGGGDKSQQSKDILQAKEYWRKSK